MHSKAARKIAEMMLAMDIQFMCAYQAFQKMSTDPKIHEIVEKTYQQKDLEDTPPLHEILKNNGLDGK